MRIYVTSVFVDDQRKALAFYTEKLGFVVKHDIPLGEHAWLTVASPEQPGGCELLLEPSTHPAVPPFKQALVEDLGLKPRLAFGPVRTAVSGRRISPPLFESMVILGRESSLRRLRAFRG